MGSGTRRNLLHLGLYLELESVYVNAQHFNKYYFTTQIVNF